MVPSTSWGRINTRLIGNMCVPDETASPHKNSMKYRLEHPAVLNLAPAKKVRRRLPPLRSRRSPDRLLF